MTKDDFKDSAGEKDKTEKVGTVKTFPISPPRPSPPGPLPPAPKPPFGLPIIPVATKVKPWPTTTESEKKEQSSFLRSHKDDE